MERLEKKRINGKEYYYYSKWERVNGKCRRTWQKYLGKLEDIVQAVEGDVPQSAEIFQFGLPTALWQESARAEIIERVDAFCPKRSQGLSVGEYVAIAAINRAIHPISKTSMFEWFTKTLLVRHFPKASKRALTSQRFWDHMDRISPEVIPPLWQSIIKGVVEREGIDLSSICYDGTNFYTFIDTFNVRCSIAKHGKNKQGRSNLRQVSYALFCNGDEQIPLYYEIYEGNRNDAKQFPIMMKGFHRFIEENFAPQIQLSQITLIFDKGNNSEENFTLVDNYHLHYVGSIKLSEVKELAEHSNQDSVFVPCQTLGLEGTQSFRVKKEIYGKQRTVIVTYNQNLFNSQWLTLHHDIAKAITELEVLQQKLEDRMNGLIKKGRCPTVDSINKQCKNILKRQYMKSILKYSVSKNASEIPILEYEIDNHTIHHLADTFLGKNIIITDRESWSNEDIILTYRSQFNIENIFKEMKNRDIGNWWPLYHWTDQKIKVHGLYCTVALLLRALVFRKVKKANIKISMKRMLVELDDIKEVLIMSPQKRAPKKKRCHTVLSRTSELQQSLLSILKLEKGKNMNLG